MYALALSLILVFSIVASVAAVLPLSQALDIPTFPFITCAPNPAGVDQVVYVNAFMSKPTPTAGMASSGDQYENISITIIAPDGSTQNIGPLRSDSTGGTWASFTPTQVGTYQLQMFYPGQILTGGGNVFGGGGEWVGSVLLPSQSDVITLTVQADSVESIYESPPLPTEYWSRPIYATNWAWGALGGSWFGLKAPSFASTGMYDAMGNVQLYSKAPNTGHIVWTKPTQFGGQPGLPISSDQESLYSATSIAINHFEPIIINGIIYYTKYASVSSSINGWAAIDLRTGETVWERTAGETGNEVIRMGQIFRFHTVQEFGSTAVLWSTELAGFFQTPTFYSLYDAATGKYLGNITDIQNLSYLFDVDCTQQGTLLGWYASDGKLNMWNSTLMFTSTASMFGAIVTIHPSGNFNYTSGVQWSVDIPTTINGVEIGSAMSVAAVTPEVVLVRYAATPGMFMELSYGYHITAGFDAKTGALLWGPINQSLPYLQDIALLAARDGVYILHNKDTNEAYGYSLTNGQKMWGPVKLPGNAWSSISRAAEIAYDKVFIWDFGGYVNALDLNTGIIEWTLTPRSSGYDAPYGIYPLWHFGTQTIADGKLFLSEGSMYNPPVHPAYRLAISCETGEIIWSILSYSGRCPGAVADGYLLEWNSFDSQLYAFGKGPTITSIEIENDAIAKGESVMIKGTVIDNSPGTKDTDREARFPHGVPAITDACMSDWMEYVYMQQIKPTDITGVEVKLTALCPDGNTYDIGTVTSDANGLYKRLWEPTMEGEYTIIATFDGSESYYPSSSETAIGVTAAQAAPTPTSTIEPTVTPIQPTESAVITPSVMPPTDQGITTETLLIIGAAIIVIVVIAAAVLLLKKRQ